MVERRDSEDVSAAEALPPLLMFDYGSDQMKMLEGMEKRYLPLNNWLHDALREFFRRAVPSDDRYTLTFDKFEVLVALACGCRRKPAFGGYWAPPGAFGYRHQNRHYIFGEIKSALEKDGNNSPFVTSRIFGETAEDCKIGLENLEGFVRELRWW